MFRFSRVGKGLAAVLWGVAAWGPAMGGAEGEGGVVRPGAGVPVFAGGVEQVRYRLGPGDTVRVTVFDEPDLEAVQRIDERGEVRLPLLGTVVLAGLDTREAELALETAFVEQRYLRKPQVSVSVAEYRVRGALVNGEVGSPGVVAFPAGRESLDILELMSLAGNATELAKTWEVKVTRAAADGQEETFVVDVRRLLTGVRPAGGGESFRVLPGDVVFVPTRIF